MEVISLLTCVSNLKEEPKKKHLIEVRHDPSIPSLPDIKLPEIQRTYRPSHFSYSFDEQDETPQRKKGK